MKQKNIINKYFNIISLIIHQTKRDWKKSRYFNRGLAKKKLFDFENSIKDYDKAIELENFARAYLHVDLRNTCLEKYKVHV